MDSEEVLERRYRLLLNAFPLPEQEARGEEMLGILLCSARPGQTRPTAAETLDLLGAAARSRTRCLLVADPVARLGALLVVALLVVAGVLTTAILERRGLLTDASPSAGGPVLLDRFPGWDPTPAKVSDSPLGPAVMTYVDGDEDSGEFTVVLAADGRSMRRVPLPRGFRYPGGSPALLSPDGTRLAQVEGGAIRVHDLITGHAQSVPGAVVDDQTRLRAWSADGTRLALTTGGTTRVVMLEDGATALEVPGAATGAAFALDGRLALARMDLLEVYDRAGRLQGSAEMPRGWNIAPAGWAATRGTLALTTGDRHSGSDPVRSGERGFRRPARGALPALVGPPQDAVPLAWQQEDLLVESGGSVDRWEPRDLTTSRVTRLDGDWLKMDIQFAAALVPDARAEPAGVLQRGPLDLVVPIIGLVLAAMAFFVGWCRPRTPGRMGARSARDALRLSGPATAHALGIAILLAPVYLFFALFRGPEFNLLSALMGVLAGAGYALGRSIGRSRDVPDPRLLGTSR